MSFSYVALIEINMYLTLNLFIIVINFSLITAQNVTTQQQPPLTPTLDKNRRMYNLDLYYKLHKSDSFV